MLEMKIALDSSAYIDSCKANSNLIGIIQSAENVYMPIIVLGEMRAAFISGSQAIKNEQILIRFLNQYGVEFLYPDEQTTHHYARLNYQLKKQGTPIPQNDLWIAALVAQHDLYLCARDKHFDALPQIPRI